MRLSEHFEPHCLVARGVHHALRGDERHDAAVADGVQPFEEKVIVNSFRGTATADRFAGGERRIEDRHVSERDVGDGCIEIVVERLFDALETLRPHILVGIEVREDFARQQVFFKGHDVGIGVLSKKRLDECAVSCGWFQQAVRAHVVIVQHVGQRLRNGGRCIECRQHGAFQAVDILFVQRLGGAVLPNQLMQFQRQRKQFEVGFRPLHGVGQIGGRIENTFQSAEPAVAGKPFPFFGSSCPPCTVQLESRAYRLDVVPQLGFTVKCHLLRV